MFNNPYNMFPYQNSMIGSNMMGISNASRIAGFNGANAIGKMAKPSFFKSLSSIKWGSVLTNTQKTLNVINQAIPVYYQMKPIWGNLKSFGKIMSVFNEPDNNTNINKVNNNFNDNQKNNNEKKAENFNLPTFFID